MATMKYAHTDKHGMRVRFSRAKGEIPKPTSGPYGVRADGLTSHVAIVTDLSTSRDVAWMAVPSKR